VQHDCETIEARLVVERPLSSSEEAALRRLFQTSAGHDFAVRFSYCAERIPPLRSGKFEDFICLATENQPPWPSIA
jgi:hypothetical protein